MKAILQLKAEAKSILVCKSLIYLLVLQDLLPVSIYSPVSNSISNSKSLRTFSKRSTKWPVSDLIHPSHLLKVITSSIYIISIEIYNINPVSQTKIDVCTIISLLYMQIYLLGLIHTCKLSYLDHWCFSTFWPSI